VLSVGQRISAIRKEPKNASVHAVQQTAFRIAVQSVDAISCPSIFKQLSVIINFGFFVVALYDAMFFAPFNIVLAKKFEQAEGSIPLSLWQVAKSLK
jgi:hypothetical protein